MAVGFENPKSFVDVIALSSAHDLRTRESVLRAAAAKQKNVFSLSALAQLLGDLDRVDEAASYFEEALACEPKEGLSCDETRALAMGWYAALIEGNGKDGALRAESLYKSALEVNDRDPLTMGNYAVFLHRVKRDHGAAAIAYKAAVEAHPSHASILCKYGGFAKHVENNYEKARGLFEAAILANPSHAESLGNLAVLLHGQASIEETVLRRIEALYKRAVHADPTNANNFSNYGLFLAEKRADTIGAEALYKKAGSIDPFHANSIYNYAVLLDSSLKKQKPAEAMYRRCLEVNPDHSYALYNLAVLLEEINRSGDFSEAKHLFECAVRASPSDALTRADYGRFLALVEKDYDGALENLREAIRCDPQCPTALFNLGKILLRRHQEDHQLMRTPDTGKIEAVDDRDQDVREAKSLLRRVIEGHGEHADASMCLARVLAGEGDYEGAARLCEAGLKGGYSDVDTISHLAVLLGNKGKSAPVLQRADDLFRRAVFLSPSNTSLLQEQHVFHRDVTKDHRAAQIAAAARKKSLSVNSRGSSPDTDTLRRAQTLHDDVDQTKVTRRGDSRRLVGRRGSSRLAN